MVSRSTALLVMLAASSSGAEISSLGKGTPAPPAFVDGYVATLEVAAVAPPEVAGRARSPEAHALLGGLATGKALTTRLYLAQDLSRQEVVNTDFVLPAGSLVLREAGAKFYVIADPGAKTYAVMDAEEILSALEGGIGIENTAFEAKVEHSAEKKVIGGFNCRKSTVFVTYVSSVPLEGDRVLVQQTNRMEVWHTPELVSSAILDHFFFKYQRDKTGAVQKVVARELGFPMEMSLDVISGTGGKAAPAAALRLRVSGVKKEKALDSELFRIPPAGYARVERSPFRIRSLSAAP